MKKIRDLIHLDLSEIDRRRQVASRRVKQLKGQIWILDSNQFKNLEIFTDCPRVGDRFDEWSAALGVLVALDWGKPEDVSSEEIKYELNADFDTTLTDAAEYSGVGWRLADGSDQRRHAAAQFQAGRFCRGGRTNEQEMELVRKEPQPVVMPVERVSEGLRNWLEAAKAVIDSRRPVRFG